MPSLNPDCELWTGKPDSQGYGRSTVDGVRDRVHRHVYRAAYGPIPPGTEIEHTCQIKLCRNPEHLRAVPHAKNMERERKDVCVRGHDMSSAYVRKNGGRLCRDCQKIRQARMHDRRARRGLNPDNGLPYVRGPYRTRKYEYA